MSSKKKEVKKKETKKPKAKRQEYELIRVTKDVHAALVKARDFQKLASLSTVIADLLAKAP